MRREVGVLAAGDHAVVGERVSADGARAGEAAPDARGGRREALLGAVAVDMTQVGGGPVRVVAGAGGAGAVSRARDGDLEGRHPLQRRPFLETVDPVVGRGCFFEAEGFLVFQSPFGGEV